MNLIGRRIELREYETGDADVVTTWTSDPEVVRWMTWGVGDRHRAIRFVEKAIAQSRARPRDIYELAIVERGTRTVIGSAGLRMRDRPNRRADIGYVLRRDRWGRGYMTEVVKLLITFGFELGLERIEATCHPDNRASARVMEKNGLRFEGRMRHVNHVDGEWWDALLFAIVTDDLDWRARR